MLLSSIMNKLFNLLINQKTRMSSFRSLSRSIYVKNWRHWKLKNKQTVHTAPIMPFITLYCQMNISETEWLIGSIGNEVVRTDCSKYYFSSPFFRVYSIFQCDYQVFWKSSEKNFPTNNFCMKNFSLGFMFT